MLSLTLTTLAAFEMDALMDESSEPPHFLAFFAVSDAPFLASSMEIFLAKSYACSVCLRKYACASLVTLGLDSLYRSRSRSSERLIPLPREADDDALLVYVLFHWPLSR